jgi:hypothetical protein
MVELKNILPCKEDLKMKKLIAKTQNGSEYLHSKENCFFCSAKAEKITEILNANKYKLKDNEKWHMYDYDFSQDYYTYQKIYIAKNGNIKTATI